MQKIVPHLWFDDKAEEAVNFYLSIFPDSKIISTANYNKEGANISGMPEGSIMTIEFELNNQRFIALNGGPAFSFTPAISFAINCQDQQEVDYFWEKLSADKSSEQCGWLKDKYGLSWQVVPTELTKLLEGDPVKSEKVMAALLKMGKIDIDVLRKAYSES